MQPSMSAQGTYGVPSMMIVTPPQHELCKDYLAGKCVRGGRCRYVHGPPNMRPIPEAVCKDYTRGVCTRASCRYFHGPQEYLQMMRVSHGSPYQMMSLPFVPPPGQPMAYPYPYPTAALPHPAATAQARPPSPFAAPHVDHFSGGGVNSVGGAAAGGGGGGWTHVQFMHPQYPQFHPTQHTQLQPHRTSVSSVSAPASQLSFGPVSTESGTSRVADWGTDTEALVQHCVESLLD